MPGSSGDITARIEVRLVEESTLSGEVHLFILKEHRFANNHACIN
jgi:hypothetical protein